jgi:hypothetical protein
MMKSLFCARSTRKCRLKNEKREKKSWTSSCINAARPSAVVTYNNVWSQLFEEEEEKLHYSLSVNRTRWAAVKQCCVYVRIEHIAGWLLEGQEDKLLRRRRPRWTTSTSDVKVVVAAIEWLHEIFYTLLKNEL